MVGTNGIFRGSLILILLLNLSAFAKTHVVVAYPYLGKIVQAIGGDAVHIKVLSSAKFDPHFVIPKPSLIPAIAKADLLVANGAGLEIGWLPPLLKSANIKPLIKYINLCYNTT